jgi:hypothetical protein
MPHIGILTAANYAWSVLTACLVLGIAIYLLDRKFGTVIYRFAYDFFHRKRPMPKDVVSGFLYGQSTNRGVTVAVFVSTVYSVYMWWRLGLTMDFLAELLVWVLMPPMLVIGFKLGYLVHKLLLRRNEYFDKLDSFNDKIQDVDLKEVSTEIRKKGEPFLGIIRNSVGLGAKAVPASPVSPPVQTPPQPTETFKERIKRYRGKQ